MPKPGLLRQPRAHSRVVRRDHRVDVAFIDLQLLDGPTGMFAAQHLRGTEKTLFVFITANATRLPSDYEGAAGVVSKPFSQAGITATIRYLASCVRNPSPDLLAV